MTRLLLLLLASLARAQDFSLVGSSVKSDKWNIKRGEQKLEEFTGNVEYKKAGRSARADWALVDHDKNTVEVNGNIRAEERLADGTAARLSGESARHDRKSGRGTLTAPGGVRMEVFYPDGSEQGRGRADRAFWNMKEGEVMLEGSAWFKETRGQIWAESARFYHKVKRLELSGRRPVLTAVGPGWTAALQADAVAAEGLPDGRRRVTGLGRARGWLNFPPGKGGLTP